MSGSLNRQQFWKYPQLPTEQMPLFMSAREIQSKYRPLEADREETEDYWNGQHQGTRLEDDHELWNRKVDEAWDSGLAQDIIKRGVQKPVHLVPEHDRTIMNAWSEHTPAMVAGGHHRIAVMGDEAPDDLIPVIHHPNHSIARSGKAYPYS